MKKSTYENLTLAGYIAEQALQVRKFVATQEQGKKYMLAIQEKHPSTVFQIDGYIIKTNVTNLLWYRHQQNLQRLGRKYS